MKGKSLIFAGVIILILTSVLIYIKFHTIISEKEININLNEEKTECYENALYFIRNGANITADELNVQNVRCSAEFPYSQWEMAGTYFENNDHSKAPKPFYFHEIRGGMAASGADGYYESCLIIDNQKIISKIETGRNLNYQSPARCAWQDKLP